jgi:hypothetical protein
MVKNEIESCLLMVLCMIILRCSDRFPQRLSFFSGNSPDRRKIRPIEGKAKCRHLKKLACKWTFIHAERGGGMG